MKRHGLTGDAHRKQLAGVGKVLRLDRETLVDGSRRQAPTTPRRYELSSSGVDDGLVGFSGSPFGGAYPQGPGLRIPPVWPNFTSDTGPQTRPRFLFCLATRTLRSKSILRGLRQGLTIGVDGNHNLQRGLTPPERPIELNVTTPDFRFVDGNVSWHLVLERNSKLANTQPITDTNNWRYQQADGSAMLYKSFTSSLVTSTGAPVIYTRGLTSYSAPLVTANWMPIEANLFSFYDIRYPQDRYAQDNLNVELDAHSRVSLYASVLQTNPNLRATCPIETTGTPPEEAFIEAYTDVVTDKGTDGPIYWRVFGSLIFEDLV